MQIKPFLTFEEQLLHLEEEYEIRAVDKPRALSFLRNNNYYRIRGYFLKEENDSYTMEDIERIYEFDALLRNKLDFILTRIEIWARTAIAHYHSEKYGPLGYLEESTFFSRVEKAKIKAFQEKCEEAIYQNSQLTFVQHYRNNYDDQYPLWVLVETLSFGTISKFYKLVEPDLVNQIIKKYFGKKAGFTQKYLTNWLHFSTILRNICAHRGRLFRRSIPVSLKISHADKKILEAQNFLDVPQCISHLEKNLFGYLFVVRKIYPDSLEWNSFIDELIVLSQKFKMNMANYGFPCNWSELLKISK